MHKIERFITRITHPVVMVLYLCLVAGAYVWVDQPLALYIHALDVSDRYPFWEWITQLGRSGLWLILLPLIVLFFRYVKPVKQIEIRMLFLWIMVVICYGICFILKYCLGRARPPLLFNQHIFGFYGYHTEKLYHSFPSGHTTIITALGLGLAILYPKQRWWFLALGGLVMLSRILLTYHYLSDVLASFYLVVIEYKLLLRIVAQQCPLYWKRLNVR